MFTLFQQQHKRIAASLAGVLCAAASLLAQSGSDLPDFLAEGLYSPNAARIASIVPSLDADVVVLEGGLANGIRMGMVCRITRGPVEIGELVVIESTRDRAAALILNLNPDNVIQTGDVARVKTIQNS